MAINLRSKKFLFVASFVLILAASVIVYIFFNSDNGSRMEVIKLLNSNIELNLSFNEANGHYTYTISRGDDQIQMVELKNNYGPKSRIKKLENGLKLISKEQEIEIKIAEDTPDFSLISVERKLKKGVEARDAVQTFEYLSKKEVHWFGGPEQTEQYYPIQKLRFQNYAYVPKETGNANIAERYWLNSEGIFFYVDHEVPLFIDQDRNFLTLTAKKALPYYTYDDEFVFKYSIGIAKNARKAHIEAVQRFLGKPAGIPDEKMIRYPVWSTWVKFGKPINQAAISNFADDIQKYKFSYSNMEIDDFWETCYGSLTVNLKTFPDFKGLSDKLQKKGFKVTLWLHPFINKNCEPWHTIANTKNFFVKSYNSSLGIDTKWWNSGENEASHLNFNHKSVVDWFKSRVNDLKNSTGVDSFKFDAGPTSFLPDDPILDGPKELSPSSLTSNYVKMCAEYGNAIEIRTGWGTQHLPVFVRMLDKDTRWTWNNGLPTLITTLLQMNLNGYVFVLPDMIGGNLYNNDLMTKELYIRWLQTTTFMPTMQFSLAPWDFDEETIEISQKFVRLHEQYADYIIDRMHLAVSNGDPVNLPIWWLDPTDDQALQTDDEYLLGEYILVAPVVKEFANSRNIYLPKGIWKDGNTDTIYVGPRWIADYSAGLKTLPFFLREKVSDADENIANTR